MLGPRARPVAAVVLAAACGAPLTADSRAAWARPATSVAVLDGAHHGIIVPSGTTRIRIDRESIAFSLAHDLDRAAVTAVYRLTNTSDLPEPVDVAFAFVRGEDDPEGPRAAIEADGAPLPFHEATLGTLLAPRLGAFLTDHPDLASELRAAAGGGEPEKLRRLVNAAGGRCERACTRLVAWQKSLGGAHDGEPSESAPKAPPEGEEKKTEPPTEDEIVYAAALEAIPATVNEARAPWADVDRRRLGFLLFHLDFQPHQTRALGTHYEHTADDDRRVHVNPTFHFDYLLSPSRRWAGFGALEVTVDTPGRVAFTSPVAFDREGTTYHAELASLPSGELRFEAMSLDGLWLGMTEPRGYWAIVIGAALAAALAIGGATGRVWGASVSWKRATTPLSTAGPLASVCALATVALLLAFAPIDALGFGTAGLGCALLVLGAAPVGAIASAISQAASARERQS